MRFTSTNSASGRWDSRDFSRDSNSHADISAGFCWFCSWQQKQQYLMGYSRYIILSDFERVEEPPAVVCGSRSLTWDTALLAVAFVLSCRLTEEFSWIINVLPNLGAGWAVAILFNISTSFCNSKMRTNLSLLIDI